MTPRARLHLLSLFRAAWPWTVDIAIAFLVLVGGAAWTIAFYALTCWLRGCA
ncbi:MAG TPA: hypothetical protein VKR31_10280 [Rhizomicrobium sp.]|nr:hypothetical protein [Rhizomicrobium sp.]